MLRKTDSLIFDMDGTLWDNVNSYVKVWNSGLERLGFEKRVNREELLGLMGKEARQLLNAVIPGVDEVKQDELFDLVIEEYQRLIPHIEPLIYPGVLEGLEKLSKKYRIFLLSNCEEDGLVNFMNHTGTRHLITDYREHGQNMQPKHMNMKQLIDAHDLKAPVYVGDTDSDSRETALAGIPFVFADYGFGNTDKYDLKFSSFQDLSSYFLAL